MSNQNIETTKRGYAAFAAGDLDMALEAFDDATEWTVPGGSGVSGTYRGRGEISELVKQVGEKSAAVAVTSLLADGDVVVALTEVTVEGETYPEATVFTFGAGRVVKVQSFGDTAAQERIFGRKRVAAG